MDIAFIGNLPPHQGGTAILAYQLLGRLVAAGHQVRAIAPVTAVNERTKPITRQVPAGVLVEPFEMPYLDINPFEKNPANYYAMQTERVLSGLRSLVAERRPDIVLVARCTFVWGVPDVARELGLPVVLWTHNAAEELARRDRNMYDGALFDQMRQADVIVACAGHGQVGLNDLGFARVEAIANAVDTAHFAPAPADRALRASLEIDPTNSVAIHVSNLKSVKRAGDLVRCAAALRECCSNLLFLIVGDGPCRERLVAEAEMLGVADRMRFAGWIDHRSINRYFNIADIAMMPSESEGLAQASLEPMACGVPLIASDIPAMREVLVPGETGLLHRVGDIDEMAACVTGLIDDDARRARLGAAARRRVERHFDFTAYASQWIDLLLDTLEYPAAVAAGAGMAIHGSAR